MLTRITSQIGIGPVVQRITEQCKGKRKYQQLIETDINSRGKMYSTCTCTQQQQVHASHDWIHASINE
jgi:hypothetical protein